MKATEQEFSDYIETLVEEAAHSSDSIIYSEEFKTSFVKKWVNKLREIIE
jgi:hypothetical protein